VNDEKPETYTRKQVTRMIEMQAENRRLKEMLMAIEGGKSAFAYMDRLMSKLHNDLYETRYWLSQERARVTRLKRKLAKLTSPT